MNIREDVVMNRNVEVEPGFDKDLRRDDFVRKNRNGNRHRRNEADFASVTPKRVLLENSREEEVDWEDDFSDIKDMWED